MKTGSTVVITYDGADITSKVLFKTASFEAQFSAIPGTFEFTCRDDEQSLGPFVTGKEVTLSVDGKLMFGGYVTQVSRKFAIPVDRVDKGVGEVKTRQWILRGVDYNILFDKRVLRFSTEDENPGFLAQLPSFLGNRKDGDLIRNDLCATYLDVPDINCVDEVEDVDYVVFDVASRAKRMAWMQQGTSWRRQMEDFSWHSGAVWYIKPDKHLLFRALEDMEAPWGFSDVPNGVSTIGFRELDCTEDGSYIVNDAMIWGGSEWAGDSGGTVFARHKNEESIDRHNRWQIAETHFGDQNFAQQAGVDARAQTIVEGSPSQQEDQLYGLKFPQWQFRFAWFGHDAPGGDHLTPGQLVMIHLYTFGDDPAHPLIKLLPLRQIRISFPNLDPQGNGYVRFDGYFGVQQNDPWTLWKYLLKAKSKTATLQIASVSNTSQRAMFGSFGSFSPLDSPDGFRTDFQIYITPKDEAGQDVPTPIGYIEGTTAVYLNGLIQRLQVDYEELDPAEGIISFVTPPSASDWLWIQCRTMAA
jgi:hypothetical protein